MAVITELTHTDVENALEQYDVGGLTQFKPATQGIENTNYFISTRKGADLQGQVDEYVLTLVEELGGDSEARRIMIEMLDRCHELGLPVPTLIRSLTGDPEGRLLDKPVLLCTRIPGSHVSHPVRGHCESIGRFLARFHLAMLPMVDKVKPYIRAVDWLTDCVDQVKDRVSPERKFLLEQSLQVVESLLNRSDVRSLPQSVIHGDLFRDNALFDSNGLTGILDFYHAGVGYQVYDIAVAINDWCVFEGKVDEQRALALIGAYNAIRSLTPVEESFLCHFLLYGALAFWLSRLIVAVREDLPEGYPIKDPVEFEQLVDRHLRRPFRLAESVSSMS